MKNAAAAILFSFLLMGMGPQKAVNAGLDINIENRVGEKALVLDTVHYKNSLGQDFTVTNFKYYLSNFSLKTGDGRTYNSPDYFLVKADDESTWKIRLRGIPPGKYESLSFLIGVDSLHNCSGAQSGALDPANGMFWAWNTGYIFLKFEGKAESSKSPGHIFEYHIGGYKAPANCIRKVTIDLSKMPVVAQAGKKSTMQLIAQAMEILVNPVAIDFSKLSSVSDFHNSPMIADNYADMFSAGNVVNEK
ncbi:MAG TPA: MbnP family protein [Bacteroidia bacterium]|nr:MbnP family protein [Bacteroidia bacterium]